MTREQFLDRYHRRPWEHPDLNFRSVDIDGAEFYWAVRPNLRLKMWVNSHRFTEWKPGSNVGHLSAFEYWQDSLQTYDEFLIL